MSGTEVVCDVHEAACSCVLPLGHDGPHECDCGGSWGFEDGEFVVYGLPISAGLFPQGRRNP